jgi:hypothetical protein
MAKGSSSAKGAIGSLFTTNNLIKTAFAATVTLYVYNKVNKETDPKSWTWKFGEVVGLKEKPKTA